MNTPLSSKQTSKKRNDDALGGLLEIMRQLRDPETGCPWDVEQNFSTIAPYTIEEAYEVADAIERQNFTDLKDELGDLLFQVVFHSQMASEAGLFHFENVAEAISEKMIRRHPHVFGDATQRSSESQTRAWEDQKAAERAEKATTSSVLDDLPLALPALLRAAKLTKRAARVGFDWPDADAVFEKLDEELTELKDAIKEDDPDHIAEEMGDLMFVISNLSRKLKLDPEGCLRAANTKFERRFRYIENRLDEDDQSAEEATLEEMEALWLEAKKTGL